jgi:hypothetical protein
MEEREGYGFPRAPEQPSRLTMTDIPRFPTGSGSGVHITYDSLHYEDVTINAGSARFAHYLNAGFRGTKFEGFNFQHCTFARCYFKSAHFKDVRFLDCSFEDCNFDQAEFTGCTLDYSEFHNCKISFYQLFACLPSRLNLRRDLVRSLKVNAQSRGVNEDARRFLMEELMASRRHNWNKAFNLQDSYYRNKYKWQDRVLGAWSWLGLSVSKLLWGYGEKPFRVVFVSGFIVIAFAIAYWLLGVPGDGAHGQLSLWEGLGYSVASFINSPPVDVIRPDRRIRIASTLEAYLGLIFFGFLVAAIFRRISQR